MRIYLASTYGCAESVNEVREMLKTAEHEIVGSNWNDDRKYTAEYLDDNIWEIADADVLVVVAREGRPSPTPLLELGAALSSITLVATVGKQIDSVYSAHSSVKHIEWEDRELLLTHLEAATENLEWQ